MEQVGTSGGTTTTTVYASPDEEASTTNGTTTTTTYFFAGPVTAVKVGSTLSYLVHDDLGSVTTALDGNGNVTATELYAPYGAVRYSTGTMPTSRGFTGQYLDTSGLNYFSARYYDPTVGQFTSGAPILSQATMTGRQQVINSLTNSQLSSPSVTVSQPVGDARATGGATTPVPLNVYNQQRESTQIGHADMKTLDTTTADNSRIRQETVVQGSGSPFVPLHWTNDLSQVLTTQTTDQVILGRWQLHVGVGIDHILGNHYWYADGQPSTAIDPQGLWSIGGCFTGFVGAAFGVTGSACGVIGVGSGGFFGGVTASAGPVATAGSGAGIGIEGQFTNANSLSDLGGWFAVGGFSVPVYEAAGFGGECFGGGNVYGCGLGGGLGVGGYIFGGATYTWTWDLYTMIHDAFVQDVQHGAQCLVRPRPDC